MALHEHSFDGVTIVTSVQLVVPNAPTGVGGGVNVSMLFETADLTAERPLIRSVFAVRVMAHTALLGRIRTDDRGRLYPTFLTIPDDLLRNTR